MQCPNCKQVNCVNLVSREQIKMPTLKNTLFGPLLGPPPCVSMYCFIREKLGYKNFIEQYECKNCGHNFQIKKSEKVD